MAKYVEFEEAKPFGKDFVIQILVDLLNVSILQLMDLDISLCQRQLAAYHAKRAHAAKVEQIRAQINERTR